MEGWVDEWIQGRQERRKEGRECGIGMNFNPLFLGKL